MYPKPIGRFHILLSEMYFEAGEREQAKKHALRASEINPEHERPKELFDKIMSNSDE